MAKTMNKTESIEDQQFVGKKWDWPGHDGKDFVPVTDTKEKFEICLELGLFAPSEIEVKTQGEAHEVWIHCQHVEKDPHHKSIEIQRAYHLPADVDMATVASHVHRDGTLSITASKKK